MGIATAVVVDDAIYLVDCGYGATRQLQRSRLSPSRLRAVFLTHLHSDHVVDIPGLIMFGSVNLVDPDRVIPVYGPGRRGMLPPLSPHAVGTVSPVSAEAPTPGTVDLVRGVCAAFATDLNDRVLNALRPNPESKFPAFDIELPEGIGYHANDSPTPEMDPFEVYRDSLVTVTATLVAHPPVAPAFAFRFENEHGSVVISGDTAPCDNLVKLAQDCDILLHEAIDFGWVERSYDVATPFELASIEHHHRAHTSPEQAVEIAIAAGAHTLALHHLVPGTGSDEAWKHAASLFPGRFLVPEDLDVIVPVPREEKVT